MGYTGQTASGRVPKTHLAGTCARNRGSLGAKIADVTEETAGFSSDAGRQKHQGIQLTHMGFAALRCFTAWREKQVLTFAANKRLQENREWQNSYFRSIVWLLIGINETQIRTRSQKWRVIYMWSFATRIRVQQKLHRRICFYINASIKLTWFSLFSVLPHRGFLYLRLLKCICPEHQSHWPQKWVRATTQNTVLP